MTPHEAISDQPNKAIAEKSDRQHQMNISAELARRGLMDDNVKPQQLSRQAVLDYIRNLEERLEQANSKKTPDASRQF